MQPFDTHAVRQPDQSTGRASPATDHSSATAASDNTKTSTHDNARGHENVEHAFDVLEWNPFRQKLVQAEGRCKFLPQPRWFTPLKVETAFTAGPASSGTRARSPAATSRPQSQTPTSPTASAAWTQLRRPEFVCRILPPIAFVPWQ